MHRASSRARFRRCVATTGNDAVTANQVTAFQAGSGVAPGSLLLAIASIVLTLAIVWAAWVTLGAFRGWQDGELSLFDLIWGWVRASIVLLVLGFYLR